MQRAARLLFFVVLLIGSTVGLAPQALAQDAEQEPAQAAAPAIDAQLDSLREMLTYARYADAATATDALLARTDLTASQRNQALEVRAVLFIARRRLPDARTVLGQLFARDPDHRLAYREAGPGVRDEFERARESHPPPLTVTLQAVTPDSLEERRAPDVTVAVHEGQDAVHELRVVYRNGPDLPFERTLMRTAEDGSHAHLPLRDGRDAYTVEYYVEALAPSGSVLATLGSPEAPLTIAVPEEEVIAQVDPGAFDVSRGGSPLPPPSGGVDVGWVVAIAAIVAVGAGVGIGLGVWTTTQGPAPGSLGQGTLMPPGAMP